VVGVIGAVGAAANPAAISHQNHRLNFQAFLEAIENNTDFCISGREARKSVEVILAIYQSAREQTIVRLR
jgi:predicted dehydrogenase